MQLKLSRQGMPCLDRWGIKPHPTIRLLITLRDDITTQPVRWNDDAADYSIMQAATSNTTLFAYSIDF